MRIVMIHGQNHEGSTCMTARALAEKVGGEVQEFFLPRDFDEPCRGCYTCFQTELTKCPHYRDLEPLASAMLEADLLILDSPVYVYHATGQMMSFLDHFGTWWVVHRPRPEMSRKQAVTISTAAGGGMKSTCRDMADSLEMWGVHRVYKLGFGVQAVKPSIVRLFDEAETVSIIKKIIGFAKKGSFLNLTLEGYEKIVAAELEIVLDIARKYGAEDLGTEYGEKWFENRITFFYPDHIMDLPQMFGTLDTVATHDNIERIYRAMKHAVEDGFGEYGVRFISHSSHWYDWGAMNYSRFIIDNPPKDPEEALRLHNQVWNCGVRAALANGGVLNDHHGVGLKLSRLVKEQYGPAIQVLQALKKELDPNGIMNPYKLGL